MRALLKIFWSILLKEVSKSKIYAVIDSKPFVCYQGQTAEPFLSTMLRSSSLKVPGSTWNHQWWHVLAYVQSTVTSIRCFLTGAESSSESNSPRCCMSEFSGHTAFCIVPLASTAAYSVTRFKFQCTYLEVGDKPWWCDYYRFCLGRTGPGPGQSLVCEHRSEKRCKDQYFNLQAK